MPRWRSFILAHEKLRTPTRSDLLSVRPDRCTLGGSVEAMPFKPLGRDTSTALCGRGHISVKLNSSVGGPYGSFIQRQRVVDDDPSWVSVGP